MAWIQSYQDLGRHPKTGRRARTLGISRPAAIGHLHLLWWWALDYAKDGELAAYDAGEIADACMWDQDADAFVEALGARLQVTLGYTEHAGWFRPWVGETAWRAPLAGAIRIGMKVEDYMQAQGYEVSFIGLRRQESARRRTHLAVHGMVHEARRGIVCNPLANWTVDEVWAAIAGMRLPYNPVYDQLAAAGIPRERRRIGPLPLSPGWILERTWPQLWRDLRARYGERW